MPAGEPRYHIISYDIGEPARLQRIHRFLKKRAMPIQYSVFLMRGTAAELDCLVGELEDMINPNEDDIRFYTLPRKPEIVTLGQQGLMDGIILCTENEDDYANTL